MQLEQRRRTHRLKSVLLASRRLSGPRREQMETLWKDIRFGVRMLSNKPAVTVIAVIALALGIGASTAIFSVVNTVLLRALPYPNGDRLVMIWEQNRPRSRDRNVISPANFFD